MKVSTVAQMRNLDRGAIEEFGISQELLIENAGQAAYFVILKEFVVLCGGGNNTGDGFVVAKKIHSNGGEAREWDEELFSKVFEIMMRLAKEPSITGMGEDLIMVGEKISSQGGLNE